MSECLPLLCDDGLPAIAGELWCGKVEDRRIDKLLRAWCHDIPKTDVDLHMYSGTVEVPYEPNADAGVVSIFSNSFAGERCRIEDDPIINHFQLGDLSHKTEDCIDNIVDAPK